MKAYLGTKIIQAEPEDGFNTMGEVVSGYKVVYEDGYESWSPKEAFEHAYHLVSKDAQALVLGTGMFTLITPQDIARIAHEVNRAYCESLGDYSQLPWDEAPRWQRDSAVDGVEFHIRNPDAGPAASHTNWMKMKLDDGWTWGDKKNADLKQHPCMVPFTELPPEQQAKDFLFQAVVHSIMEK